MTAFGWYPHNPRDFLEGVQGLGPDAIGAYIVVLDLIYARGGSTPADYRYLGGLMGCSSRLAKGLVERLIEAGKLALDDGHLTNERARKTVETQAKVARTRAESGAKGGRNRAEKACGVGNCSDLGQANGLQEGKQNPSYKEREKEKKKKDNPSNQPLGVAREAGPAGDAAMDAAGPLDAPAGPGLAGGDGLIDGRCAEWLPRIADAGGLAMNPAKRKAALALLADWLAGWAGCDLETDLLAPMREFLAGHDGPTHSLARFDAVIRDRKARAVAVVAVPAAWVDRGGEGEPELRMRAALQGAMGEADYRAWIEPAALKLNGVSLAVRCPGEFHADHVANHFKPALRAIARQIGGPAIEAINISAAR